MKKHVTKTDAELPGGASDRDQQILARLRSIELQLFQSAAENDHRRDEVMFDANKRLDQLHSDISQLRKLVVGLFGLSMLMAALVFSLNLD